MVVPPATTAHVEMLASVIWMNVLVMLNGPARCASSSVEPVSKIADNSSPVQSSLLVKRHLRRTQKMKRFTVIVMAIILAVFAYSSTPVKAVCAGTWFCEERCFRDWERCANRCNLGQVSCAESCDATWNSCQYVCDVTGCFPPI